MERSTEWSVRSPIRYSGRRARARRPDGLSERCPRADPGAPRVHVPKHPKRFFPRLMYVDKAKGD